MILNFIKVTLRNFIAHKGHYSINILGLAIGIACALLTILYINHELNYDKFHKEFDSIYRVTLHGKLKGTEFNGATTSAKMAPELLENDLVADATRITRLGAWLIAKDSIRYNEDNLLFVDANFFRFFTGFELVYGNFDSLLVKPRSLVLTETSAIKYFGTTDNLIGRELKVETKGKPYVVTGIVKDPPSYSHIKFDILSSFSTYEDVLTGSWTSNNVYTYINAGERENLPAIITHINNLVAKYIEPELAQAFDDVFRADDEYSFSLQPLAQIHLNSDLSGEIQQNGNSVYVYSLGIAAMIILIVACLNFMNLSTANSANRSFEVSLRKIIGADKSYLITQFLVESLLISLISLSVALIFAELMLPAFNRFLDLQLEFGLFRNIKAVLVILLFTAGVGILSGSYPAFFIAGFDPVKSISDRHASGMKSNKIRSIFVLMQFFISILVIILTVVIYSQVRFMMQKELGFEKDNMLVIRRSDALKDNLKTFKTEIRSQKDVLSVTNANSIPGRNYYLNTLKLKGESEETALLFNQVFVKYDFAETFDLNITQGRFFNPDVASDTFACVINQRAAEEIGLSYPIGAELVMPKTMKHKSHSYKVIGVVEDFHFQSLNKEIEPLLICYMPGNWEGYITVKLSEDYSLSTLAFLEQKWYEYAPAYPFVYFFLSEDFNKNYVSLIKLGRIFIIFSVLAVFIACLGLYGMVASAVNSRGREIGIRQSQGASLKDTIRVLGSETIRLLIVSILFASISAFFVARVWLSNFYYRIDLNPWHFLSAILAVLIVVIPIILHYAMQTAKGNPGLVLKYD